MTIKVTRPQIDLREEINKALTLQGLETQSITVNGLESKGKLDVGGTAKAGQYLLEAIDKIKPEVAVDVFVYDTRKDSDGGAWRKRTQHTSWYNETLNTATRGSRREFPAVAVFVAEAARVTIYDGDDPNLPMWMEWNTTGALGWASGTDSVWVTLTVLNGIMAWGTDNRGCGFANFVKDKIEVVHGAQRYVLKDESIALRESSVGVEMSASDALGGYSFPAANDEIYDVAATVLPNAPIDPDSGLPRPTLAYAGPSGLNIITDAGDTLLITAGSGSTYNGVSWVGFTENHNLIFEQDNSTNPRSVFCIPVPTANRTTQTNDGSITDKVILKWYANGAHKPYPVFSGGGVVEAIPMSGDNQAMRSDTGKLTLAQPKVADPAQGKVAYIGSDYNTGWMHGDTRLATLSDTDINDVVGTELVDFSAASDWTVSSSSDGSHSFSSGVLTITNDNSSDPPVFVYQAITTVVGETYVLTATSASGSSLANFALIASSTTATSGAINNVASGVWTAAGTVLANTFTATGTTTYVLLRVNANAAGTNKIASCSLRIAERDHSEYNTSCQVVGTITKNPVATGADLVGYSGFTTSNYIWQPYNSELDFTDEMSIMFWVKDWVASTDLLHLGPFNTRNSQTSFFLYNDGGYDYRFSLTSDGTTEQPFEIAGAGNRAGWQQVCFTLKAGVVTGFLNGKQHITGAFTGNIYSQSSAQNGLFIGDGPVSGAFTGSLALLRLSATAPNLDQVAAMYNDEKHLFKENAKATLAGEDGHARAMAYDDDTEILHVGTLESRSDFQGLRRVNETTDEIAFALSASNGMVAGE